MRGQSFGFGSRLSSSIDSVDSAANRGGDGIAASRRSAGAEDSGGSDSGFLRRSRANHELSASAAASNEQGHISMCSFDGFFINITEDVLNKSNEDCNEAASAAVKDTGRTSSPKVRMMKPRKKDKTQSKILPETTIGGSDTSDHLTMQMPSQGEIQTL